MIIKERYDDEEYYDNKDYSVSVGLGEAVECYYVFADSVDEAEMEAVDLAFDDLSVLYIDDEGTGYYVELLLAGQTTGIGYTVNAFNEADAEEKAKRMAADDFYTQINY